MDTIAGKISKTVDLIAYYTTSHRMLDNNIKPTANLQLL